MEPLDVLKKYGGTKDDIWELKRGSRSVKIVLHKALERIATQAGIRFDAPQIIEADSKNGVAVVCVTGHLEPATEWSIGEASPKNNKNEYPWAMAEKRAKDRVILKLLGLHGDVYSEEEADDFKRGAAKSFPPGPAKNRTELRKLHRKFNDDLLNVDASGFDGLLMKAEPMLEQLKADLPGLYYGGGKVGQATEGVRGLLEDIEDARRRVGLDPSDARKSASGDPFDL